MSCTIEIIDKVLNHPNITVTLGCDGKSTDKYFERWRTFTVKGDDAVYKIEWYCNISYLHIGKWNVIVPFHRVEQMNTWPNRSKMNLQFYYCEHVCCVLKIEDWEGLCDEPIRKDKLPQRPVQWEIVDNLLRRGLEGRIIRRWTYSSNGRQ